VSKNMHWGVFVLAACSSIACVVESVDPDQTVLATADDELFISRGDVWKTLSIPVCFESDVVNNISSTKRGWVKDAVTKAWQNNSRVKFTGWGTCTDGASGVHIGRTSSGPSTDGLGRDLSGVNNGMLLKFDYSVNGCVDDNGNSYTQETCIRDDAIHEFGHALAMAHEANRLDSPCLDKQGTMGDIYVGQYDPESIMNYCRSTAQGTLTDLDLLGLHFFYGDPNSGTMKKDALVWQGADAAYFFMGKNYTKYSTLTDRVYDFYPSKFDSSTWPGWPSASPWSNGTDASIDYGNGKAYFFSGNQYLRYDKATDKVDSNYPKTLPGGWQNWPSTWTSVDAAIRWDNGRVYMFRGSEYLRITSGVTVDAGYPKPISGNWSIPYTSGFDYVLIWPNDKAYFFKGTQYARYDLASDTTDSGYPLDIVGRWPGAPF
jgi:hypothetical protein